MVSARRRHASIIGCLLLAAVFAVLPCALQLALPGQYARAARVPGEKTWDFERFDVDIKVNTDGSLTVRETQVVNFTGSFSFLNRDLLSEKGKFDEGRSYGAVRFKDIKVYDLEGRAYSDFKVEGFENGKRVRVGFNALNEQKGWIFEYRMTGALIYADEYDRLYFNTVSYDRGVPVKSSRTTVTLPDGTDMDEVRSTEYPDTENPPGSFTSGRDGGTLWWEVAGIRPQTTFTIDVAFPKGLVAVPLTYRPWFGAVVIALASLLAIAAIAAMLVLWYRKGRDAAAPELDVVRYEPPPDLRPAEVGVLVNESPSTSDITATIVDLAVRRKLVINEREEGRIRKRKEFTFQKWEPGREDLAPFERELMDGLFEAGDTVSEDDLKNKFYSHISSIDSELKEQVLSKGYFDGDPAKVKGRYSVIGLALASLIIPLFLLRSRIDLGYLWAFAPALAVTGVGVFIIGRYMSRRTAKGSEALSYVMGFKEYMATAEQEEMKFMTPENFQANLPYAMVLNVERKWAEKFKDIFVEPPDWYRGYYPGAAFSTVYLADSLSRMRTTMGTTLTSSPSSSGGGGGFGGGSSGGGFGGGGSSAG